MYCCPNLTGFDSGLSDNSFCPTNLYCNPSDFQDLNPALINGLRNSSGSASGSLISSCQGTAVFGPLGDNRALGDNTDFQTQGRCAVICWFLCKYWSNSHQSKCFSVKDIKRKTIVEGPLTSG